MVTRTRLLDPCRFSISPEMRGVQGQEELFSQGRFSLAAHYLHKHYLIHPFSCLFHLHQSSCSKNRFTRGRISNFSKNACVDPLLIYCFTTIQLLCNYSGDHQNITKGHLLLLMEVHGQNNSRTAQLVMVRHLNRTRRKTCCISKQKAF